MFNIVEKFNSYVFEDNLPPQFLTASYELRPLFTYSIGYWEAYRRFQGDFYGGGGEVGEWVTWEDVDGGSSHGGRDISMKGVPDFPALFKKR